MADGRRLAYAEWGDPDGSPVLFFHGTPHSRLWCPDEGATAEAKVRLIAIDRPGIGGSDAKEARTFGDWPMDVLELADSLRLDRFAVIGWSGGGPYAGACAALIPQRLTAIAIVSSKHLARFNFIDRPQAVEELDSNDRAEFELAHRNPLAAAELSASHHTKWAATLQERPEVMFDSFKTAEGDRWYFDDDARTASLGRALIECFRQGLNGLRWEFIDAWLPWGFRLADIHKRVHVWHGAQDSRVSTADTDFLAHAIRNCQVSIWPDCGHLGIAKHWGAILGALS
ncbi:MAG: alpha/beta fold hydrolase [Candidatus Dormibacteraceae bacterium]